MLFICTNHLQNTMYIEFDHSWFRKTHKKFANYSYTVIAPKPYTVLFKCH